MKIFDAVRRWLARDPRCNLVGCIRMPNGRLPTFEFEYYTTTPMIDATDIKIRVVGKCMRCGRKEHYSITPHTDATLVNVVRPNKAETPMTPDDFLAMAAMCEDREEHAQNRGLSAAAEKWAKRASWCYRQSAMQRHPDLYTFTATDVPPPKEIAEDG
jgi:hypothetical protein